MPLSYEDVAFLNKQISNVCSQKIDPPFSVTTEIMLFDEGRILVIDVPMGKNKFYIANGKDIWVKLGANKRKAKREELKILLQESRNLFEDEQAVENTSFRSFYKMYLEEFIQKKMDFELENDMDYDMDYEKILHNMKLMKDDKCTLAGLLLFGKKRNMEKSFKNC